MREIAEAIAGLIDQTRIGSATQFAIRFAMAACMSLAVVACWWWAPVFVQVLLLAFAVVFALGTLGMPDSLAVGCFISVVAGWWFLGGWRAPWWQAVCVALLLTLVHLLAAASATVPFHARFTRRALRRVARSMATMVGVSLLAMLLVVLVALVPPTVVPRGLVWLFVAAAAVLLAAGWVTRRR